jgi:hypothetical protein
MKEKPAVSILQNCDKEGHNPAGETSRFEQRLERG